MDVVSGGTPRDPTLFNLTDALVSDTANLPEAELIAEMKADGLDPDAEVARMRAVVASAIIQSGKARLAEAKQGVTKARKVAVAALPPLRVANADTVLRRFANDDVKLRNRLTMAARNGEGLTEREADQVLNNLRELGAIDDEGNPV